MDTLVSGDVCVSFPCSSLLFVSVASILMDYGYLHQMSF